MQVYESLSVFIAYKNEHTLFKRDHVFDSQRMFIFLSVFHMLLKSNVVLFSRLSINTHYLPDAVFKDGDTKMRKPGPHLVEPAVLQEPLTQTTPHFHTSGQYHRKCSTGV